MSVDCEVSVASVGNVVRFPSHGSTTHDARTPSAKKSRWGKSDDELHNFNNILIWLNNKGQLIFYKIKLKSTVYSKDSILLYTNAFYVNDKNSWEKVDHRGIFICYFEFQSYTSVFTPTETNSRYRPMYNPTADLGGYQNTVGSTGSPLNQSAIIADFVRRTSSNVGNLSTICEDSEDASNKCIATEDTDDKKPILS